MDKKHLDFEDRVKIEKVKDSNFSNKDIAEFLGIHLYHIKNEFSRNGGRENYSAEMAQKRSEQGFIKRKLSYEFRKTNPKILTLEDRKSIEKYKNTELSGKEIGDKIGRHKNVVNREFKLFPNRKDYDAQKSYDIYLKTKEDKFYKLRKEIVHIDDTLEIDKNHSEEFIKNKRHTSVTNIFVPDYIPKFPLKVWMERFKEEFSSKRVNWRREIKYLEFWIRHLGDRIAVDISPLEIENFANLLLKQKNSKTKQGFLSRETRRKYLMILSMIYNTAILDWKWAVFNPVSSTDTRRSEKKPYVTGTHDENKSHEILRNKFVDLIQNKIQDTKMTLRELAKKCGTSLNILQRVLSKNENTTLRTACKICDALGLKIEIMEL